MKNYFQYPGTGLKAVKAVPLPQPSRNGVVLDHDMWLHVSFINQAYRILVSFTFMPNSCQQRVQLADAAIATARQSEEAADQQAPT